jgi:hypothetical protein
MRRSTIALMVIAVAVVAIVILVRAGDDTPGVASGTTSSTSDDSTVVNQPESTTTMVPTPGFELPPGTLVCDLYGTLTVTGTSTNGDLVEASGIAVSRTTPNVLWSHNDSRDGPRLYAFAPDGTDLGVFDVPGGFALDWEDMAAGPGPDGTGAYLYAGDIGDNFSIRDGIIAIHRVEDLDPASMTDGSFPRSDPIPLVYPDGAHNAEALFVDPIDPAIYIVTKTKDIAQVFRGPLDITGEQTQMELVASIDLGDEVSGADISPDGSIIAFRGYRTVWMWHRAQGQTIADALATPPCNAPSPDEPQGEAIAFDSTHSYFTISEDISPAIYRIPFEG